MPVPVTDERALALLRCYRERFGKPELSEPAEWVAEYVGGLKVEEEDPVVVGMLRLVERQILVNAAEQAARRNSGGVREAVGVGHAAQCR